MYERFIIFMLMIIKFYDRNALDIIVLIIYIDNL